MVIIVEFVFVKAGVFQSTDRILHLCSPILAFSLETDILTELVDCHLPAFHFGFINLDCILTAAMIDSLDDVSDILVKLFVIYDHKFKVYCTFYFVFLLLVYHIF